MTGTAAGGPPAALELAGISKRFGSITAVNGVDLIVRPGTVHALLGENGAGKTTLMRIAYGMVSADAGSIRLFGREVGGASIGSARRTGVGMVHQHLSLVPTLTAAENVALGGRRLFRPRLADIALQRAMDDSGLRVPISALARDLSVVEQQRLEILKALSRNARLLILDEPTTGLAPAEIDDLLRWARSFAERGGSIVLVTHKLKEALAIADDVTVLRRGRVARVSQVGQATERDLARAIFPDATDAMDAPPGADGAPPGEALVIADRVSVANRKGAMVVSDASFRIHRHELVGIAAVEGSGHRELLRAISGLMPSHSGTLRLPPRIALIPADRTREALIPDFTLVENVALHGAGARTGRVSWGAFAERTNTLLRDFDIVAPSSSALARTLSGGNQQRLVVARELASGVDLVVADDPTRGLDIKAASFVHTQLRAAARRGAAVVVHCSDLDELLALTARVLVVFHGTVREVPPLREAVGAAMLGGVA